MASIIIIWIFVMDRCYSLNLKDMILIYIVDEK